MPDQPNLVTTCTFKGKEYLVKMNVINGNNLELCITDKHTAEDWQCSYDATYIENITHKTGNFKQFDIFVAMMKSGLLKTSECVTLDLLTYDDLELLRNRRITGRSNIPSHGMHSHHMAPQANRRYLILTYTVEFDRIHYPLPMEYCGPPDPQVLQGIIRRLEGENERLQEQLRNRCGPTHTNALNQISKLEKRVQDVSKENKILTDEVQLLNKTLSKRSNTNHQVEILHHAIESLEEQVLQERTSFQRLVRKLRDEKAMLLQKVEELQSVERNLRNRLRIQSQGRNACNFGQVPGISQTVEQPNLLTSRHPGDGLGSPLREVNYNGQKLRSVNASRSPHWAKSVQEHKSLRQVMPAVIDVNKKTVPSKSRSVGCFLTGAVQHRRSSSESSCGSRKQNIVLKCKKSVGDRLHLTDELQKVNNIERGRQPLKRHHLKKRSSSETSAGSIASGKLLGNHRKKKSGTASRHSSGSSDTSRHTDVRIASPASGDHRNIESLKLRRRKKSKDFKLGLSDLESRIQALQKLLKEGLVVKR